MFLWYINVRKGGVGESATFDFADRGDFNVTYYYKSVDQRWTNIDIDLANIWISFKMLYNLCIGLLVVDKEKVEICAEVKLLNECINILQQDLVINALLAWKHHWACFFDLRYTLQEMLTAQ